MIAFANTSPCRKLTPTWHSLFLKMLPQIRQQARSAFRWADPEAQEELIAETVANAFSAFARLVERGKTELAYPTPLAQFAIRQLRSGRRVGAKLSVNDVSSRYAQLAKGIVVDRLDHFDHEQGEWRETLLEDRKAGPAETAAARIDVADWFKSLARGKRRIAKTLARGEATSAVAAMFGLTPGRISQLRQELKQSWESFQSQAAVA
jgi:hypothetical protein